MLVRDFGVTPAGQMARTWRMTSAAGASAEVTDFGACLVSLCVPDAQGVATDVVLGYDNVDGYVHDEAHFGAVIGRYANRIGGASFELDGVRYELAGNENGNSLHSGPNLWRTRLWEVVRAEDTAEGGLVELRLQSPDGDQGFPGSVDVHVTYELAGTALSVTYAGTPTARTIMNLTNHSYFNLNGQASGSVLGHHLTVEAAERTETADDLVPTGRILPVAGTPLDLREGPELRAAVESGEPSIVNARGLDHNYVLADAAGECRRVARLVGDASGIALDVATDLPGIQVYTANYIEGVCGKGGHTHHAHDAVCLETQFFPDAPHHATFPQPVFGPERPYFSRTVFSFGLA